MNITREQLEQLARIYNTLLNVEVKGENIFVMSDCLRAMEKVITDIDKTAAGDNKSSTISEASAPAFTPEVVEG